MADATILRSYLSVLTTDAVIARTSSGSFALDAVFAQVRLPSGEILATFMMAEAFEAPNGATWLTRSTDGGRTYLLQSPVYSKSILPYETTDALKATLLADGSLIVGAARAFG